MASKHSMNAAARHWPAIMAFLVVRGVISLALFFLTGGEEVASDTRMHLMVIDEPLAILSGRADLAVASYPPLQFLLTWPLYRAFQSVAPDMLAIRMLMCAIELGAFVTLLAVLERRPSADARVGTWLRWLFVLGPHQFVASAVFVQEEVICQLFVLLAVLALAHGNKTLAGLWLAAGVLLGKIFLALPLLCLTVLYRPASKDAWAWALVIGTYALNVAWATINDGLLPLVGFNPYPDYASSYWVPIVTSFPDSMESIKRISLGLSALLQAIVLASLYRRSIEASAPVPPLVLLCLPLTAFYLTFYQHMPEYLLTMWPAFLLLRSGAAGALFFAAVANLAWAPNLFFGLMNVGIVNSSKSGTRNRILEPLTEGLGVDFAALHLASIAAYSIAYAVAFAWMWRTSLEAIGRSPRSGTVR